MKEINEEGRRLQEKEIRLKLNQEEKFMPYFFHNVFNNKYL